MNDFPEEKEEYYKFPILNFLWQFGGMSVGAFATVFSICQYTFNDKTLNIKTNVLFFSIITGILVGLVLSLIRSLYSYIKDINSKLNEYRKENKKLRKNNNGLKNDNSNITNKYNNLCKDFETSLLLGNNIVESLNQATRYKTDAETEFLNELVKDMEKKQLERINLKGKYDYE